VIGSRKGEIPEKKALIHHDMFTTRPRPSPMRELVTKAEAA